MALELLQIYHFSFKYTFTSPIMLCHPIADEAIVVKPPGRDVRSATRQSDQSWHCSGHSQTISPPFAKVVRHNFVAFWISACVSAKLPVVKPLAAFTWRHGQLAVQGVDAHVTTLIFSLPASLTMSRRIRCVLVLVRSCFSVIRIAADMWGTRAVSVDLSEAQSSINSVSIPPFNSVCLAIL